MSIKNTSIVAALLLLQLVAWAQPAADKYAFLRKSGDKEYNALRYRYALPYYRAYLQKNTANSEVKNLLGDCYYNMRNYDSALQIYSSLAEKNTAVQEKLAELYAWSKEYAAAIKIYQQLIAESKSMSRKKYYEERRSGFERAHFFYKDSLDWGLQYLSINTSAQEFSPLLFGQGLVFASNRKNGNIQPLAYGWDGHGFEQMFWIKDRADLFSINPQSIKKEVERNLALTIDKTPATSNDNNTLAQKIVLSKTGPAANTVPLFTGLPKGRGHSGPMCISDQGNTIYFTRNRADKVKGVYLLEICSIKKTMLGWGPAKVLSLNEKGSSSYHPAINADGTILYFASNRDGGIGGADLYKVEKLNDSTWSAAENMGPRVNTLGDEVFPCVNGNKLFFSSNGWAGLGGLDLFETTEITSKKNPSNLGYPVNSSSDDFGYVSTADGREGYFSSNRYGTDDLFGYKYEKYYRELTGTIMSAETRKLQPGVQLKLYLLEASGNKILVDTTESDDLGHYKFNTRSNEKYILTIDGTSAIVGDNSGEIATATNPINNGIWVVHANMPKVTQTAAIPPVSPITTNRIDSLKKDGKSGAVATATNPKSKVNGVTTVNKPVITQTAATPPTSPIANNWFDSLKNSSKFSFILYHPFDKATYRAVDEKIVQKVIQLLQDHPEYQLHIVSATDCKGSQEYNQALSERRARYVLNHLPKPQQAKAIMRCVSKNELREPCEQGNGYNETSQEINRYTYLFISDVSEGNNK